VSLGPWRVHSDPPPAHSSPAGLRRWCDILSRIDALGTFAIIGSCRHLARGLWGRGALPLPVTLATAASIPTTTLYTPPAGVQQACSTRLIALSGLAGYSRVPGMDEVLPC
jgi:hypothetical protein